MGHDCTLHVVDERLIRERFVPRLLGRSDERSTFDDREKAEELWARVRQALAREGEHGNDPGATAGLIAQLAVAYCAAELPYHYERGFCLSLWPDQPDGLHAKVPKKLVGDPEAPFADVVAARQDLKGRFPREIESNYCTGLYVPAGNVPELLSFVERKVKRYKKPERRLFRGLLLVLRYAAEHGLAYWEGTDLPVPMATMQPPESERRAGVEEFLGPERFCMGCVGEAQPILVLAHMVGHPQRCLTASADLSAWPPALTISNEYALEARRSRGGRWVCVSSCSDIRSLWRVRVGEGPVETKRVLLPPDEREHGTEWADFVGERVVAVLQSQRLPSGPERYLPAVPLIEQDGGLVPIEGLPVPPDYPQGAATYGVAHLNDGTDVLLWLGKGYELRDGRLEPTLEWGETRLHGELTVPWGSDGFFYAGLASKTLWSCRRGQAPMSHLPKLDGAIWRISPGPDDSVVIKLGHSRKGDLGLIYFPDEETYIRLEDELFPDEAPDDIETFHWAAECGRFIAATPRRLWAAPIEAVLGLPRYNANTGRQIRH